LESIDLVIIDLIITITIAVLSGMGVGSAGILIIYLTAFKDVTRISAQMQNLIFYIISCGCAFLFQLKKRRLHKEQILPLIITAIPGVLLGVYLTTIVRNEIAEKIFGALLIFAGTSSLVKLLKSKFS
jgi:uncharacterized membrane protein YfcA